MFQVKLSEATAARRRIPVLLVDITDGFTPEVGVVTPTINISKNGATVATGAGTWAEIGNGQYYYEFTTGEVDTLGWVAVNIEKATVSRDYNAVVQIMAYDALDSVRLGLTALPNVAAGANGGLPTGNASGQVLRHHHLQQVQLMPQLLLQMLLHLPSCLLLQLLRLQQECGMKLTHHILLLVHSVS